MGICYLKLFVGVLYILTDMCVDAEGIQILFHIRYKCQHPGLFLYLFNGVFDLILLLLASIFLMLIFF